MADFKPMERPKSDNVGYILLDIIQDALILFILCIFFGRLIERLFFPEESTPQRIKQRGSLSLFILIFLQILIDVFAVYLIRTVTAKIPPIIGPQRQREITAVEMALIVSLIFVACQPSLLLRINEFVHRF